MTFRIGQPYLEEVEKGGFRSYTRAESVRNIFLLKWKILEALPVKEFYNQHYYFDDLLSKEIRKLVPLTISTDKIYGQLVDVTDFQIHSEDSEERTINNGEFYRIFQNHKLWEKRYIKSNVSCSCLYSRILVRVQCSFESEPIFTLFENYSKCRIWIFHFRHSQPIFVQLKLTYLVTLFDRKLQVFKNAPKLTIFGIFN